MELEREAKTDTSGPRLAWKAVAERLVHPRQIAILESLRGGAAAPSDLKLPEEKTASHTAYHFTALKQKGLIELHHTEVVRGTIKHYYRLAPAATGAQNTSS
jgi:DNA-binding transcriptional ArsR family regulator